MALLHCNFFSEALSLSTSMSVILPGRPGAEPPPVLYLLHGLSDDDSSWVRRTSIERYVEGLTGPLAVVLPQVHRSYYTDQAYGGRYWTFLTEELPALVAALFRVSDRREDTFVAGLSMGGYGALKWALRHPERFAAAASLSGALHVAGSRFRRQRPEDPMMVQRIFGEQSAAGGPNDLMALARAADRAQLPALGLWCGSEDYLLEANRLFVDTCAAAGVPVKVTIGPGDHEWGYWDAAIQEVLAWLPLRARGGAGGGA
ncbi:MAG TPA: alpha/beta hydrolase family protein [Propionibacteriaceae bacterium]|nr:alpha/beta hydrolase family protein [Propionibacteriaceae bacterium]